MQLNCESTDSFMPSKIRFCMILKRFTISFRTLSYILYCCTSYLTCLQVPKDYCKVLTVESCQELPSRDCNPKARRVCSLIPKVTSKEVSDLECKTHENRVCKPTYREVKKYLIKMQVYNWFILSISSLIKIICYLAELQRIVNMDQIPNTE